MENQVNIGDQNTQQIGLKPPSQPLPIQGKPRVNFWMISTIILLALLILGGVIYLLSTNKQSRLSTTRTELPTNQPQNQPTGEPLNTNMSSSAIIKSNQIRIGGLQLIYPDQWIPIFAPQNNSKNVVYFAKSQQEAQSLSNCVSQTCSSYSLKLEDFGNAAVWTNYSVEDFIKQVRPDIQLNNLQKTTLGTREAWWGYTDTNKLTHQTVITAGNPQAKSFIAIFASGSDRQMMEDYVSRLPSVIVTDYKDTKPKDFLTKNGYIIDLSSSFVTENYFLVTFILDSLLAPQNSTKSYHYLLYTESKTNPESNVGSPNYPKSNYLNSKYYLLTDNDQLREGVYGTPQVQIKLTSPSVQNLGSYLADPKYCQQDSDCLYRSNFCTIGAYNIYHQFSTPWGCGSGGYEGLGNSMDLQQKLGCKSDVEVKYDTLKCINNACQAINAKPSCKQ